MARNTQKRSLMAALGCVALASAGDAAPLRGFSTAKMETPLQAAAEQLRRMTQQNPVLRQSLSEADMQLEGAQFVEVVVAQVTNPQKRALVFDVRFEHGGASDMLGSFSLFPPDNPGRFIVATQGRVRAPGDIVLSLESGENMGLDDTVNIGVASVRLISGK